MDELRVFVKSIPSLPRGTGDRCEFKFGNCTYSCNNTDEAVTLFAKRALAGLRYNPHSCATKSGKAKGRPRRTVFDQFLDDGELDNAAEYARITNLPIYYFASLPLGNPEIIRKARLIEPGFVCGFNGEGWTVTHLDSGYSVTIGSNTNAKKAIASFNECKRRPEFDSKIKAALCNLQEKLGVVSFI